ncbi:MAG: hypothetical protein WCI92_14155 [Bacteroidota bacterium]
MPSPRSASAGWLHVLFPVTVIAEKSNYTEARQEKSTLRHHELLYIIGSYGLGRKPISPLCTIGLKPSSHCLHQPFLPTPPTFPAAASHSLLIPRNFMPFAAPTAANG